MACSCIVASLLLFGEAVRFSAGLPATTQEDLTQGAATTHTITSTMTLTTDSSSLTLTTRSETSTTTLSTSSETQSLTLTTATGTSTETLVTTTETLTAVTSTSTLSLVTATGTLAVLPAASFSSTPSAGGVTVTPVRGEAMRTSFTVATHGWQASQLENVTYEFYSFPISAGSALAYDNGTLVCTGACALPAIEWDDATSSDYYVRLGGTFLSEASPKLEARGMIFPAGSFFVVARARHVLGAYGLAYSAGPFVSDATNVEPLHVLEAITNAAGSTDPLTLLNALDVMASVSSSAALKYEADDKVSMRNITIGALESIAGSIDGSMNSIQRTGEVVASVVANVGDAIDLSMRDLERIAQVLVDAAHVGMEGVARGINQKAAQGMLGGIAVVMSQSTGTDSHSQDDAARFSVALETAVQALANSMASFAQEGEAIEASAIHNDGSGVLLGVVRKALPAAADGALGGDVLVPAEAFVSGGRRLSSACTSASLQRAVFLSSNLFHWASSAWEVAANATLKSVSLDLCGELLGEIDPPLQIALPAPWPQDSDFAPVCLRWNHSSETWSDVGLAIDALNWHPGTSPVTCLSSYDTGIYTVALQAIHERAVSSLTMSNLRGSSEGNGDDSLSTAELDAKPTTVIIVGLSAGVLLCLGLTSCACAMARQSPSGRHVDLKVFDLPLPKYRMKLNSNSRADSPCATDDSPEIVVKSMRRCDDVDPCAGLYITASVCPCVYAEERAATKDALLQIRELRTASLAKNESSKAWSGDDRACISKESFTKHGSKIEDIPFQERYPDDRRSDEDLDISDLVDISACSEHEVGTLSTPGQAGCSIGLNSTDEPQAASTLLPQLESEPRSDWSAFASTVPSEREDPGAGMCDDESLDQLCLSGEQPAESEETEEDIASGYTVSPRWLAKAYLAEQWSACGSDSHAAMQQDESVQGETSDGGSARCDQQQEFVPEQAEPEVGKFSDRLGDWWEERSGQSAESIGSVFEAQISMSPPVRICDAHDVVGQAGPDTSFIKACQSPVVKISDGQDSSPA